MPEMSEGQWDLDGFTFGGAGSPLLVSRASDFGGFTVEHQEVPLPGVDGVHTGRGDIGSATWTLQMFTNHRRSLRASAALAALDTVREVAAAWRASAKKPAGATSTLRLNYAGRTIQLIGRAGSFSMPRPDKLTHQGKAVAIGQFKITDPVVYADAPSDLALELVQATDGGAVWPVTWPVVWGSSSIARQGIVYVEGDADVPFTITVDGPVTGQCSDITLTGPGWAVDVPGPLAFDEQLIIDTRAMTATIGGRHGIVMSRRSRLNARLQTGPSEITFTCTDATLTARATIAWRAGWYSL